MLEQYRKLHTTLTASITVIPTGASNRPATSHGANPNTPASKRGGSASARLPPAAAAAITGSNPHSNSRPATASGGAGGGSATGPVPAAGAAKPPAAQSGSPTKPNAPGAAAEAAAPAPGSGTAGTTTSDTVSAVLDVDLFHRAATARVEPELEELDSEFLISVSGAWPTPERLHPSSCIYAGRRLWR